MKAFTFVLTALVSEIALASVLPVESSAAAVVNGTHTERNVCKRLLIGTAAPATGTVSSAAAAAHTPPAKGPVSDINCMKQ
jgi:hypothetical protein